MTECEICTYADEHGWWGPGHTGTHCRACHRSWTSTAQAHCTVCHGHFASNGAADRHWRGNRHVDPEQVDGLYLGGDGIWSTSEHRDPGALAARLAAVRYAKAAA